MKKKLLIISQVLALALLASCNNENVSQSDNVSSTEDVSSSIIDQEASSEKLVSLLSSIDVNKVVSYDFVDRSYTFNYYNNPKYFVTGNFKTGWINYKAAHSFKLYNHNVITDSVSIEALDGVETTIAKTNDTAKGQIFVKDGYIYDYFMCETQPNQSFVNCQEIDYYHTYDSYFNYLSIIEVIKNAFNDPNSYFPTDSGYEAPVVNIETIDGVEHYNLSCQYPGDDSYKPIIINYSVSYDTKTKSFKEITYNDRSMLDKLDTDYEIGTSALTIYTISNLTLGNKDDFKDTYYTLDDIPNESSIHNAPKKVIDVSNVADGAISEDMALDIIRNIYAYSNNVRQTNYSMIYHGAFDFAETGRTEFGDAKFEGKIIAYKNNITDNNGYIQLVDENDLPNGEKASYRIFTKAIEGGIIRGGQFTNYITSAYAGIAKSYINSARNYLDANPLYWTEIASILEDFTNYDLGKTTFNNGATMEVTVSGVKKGNDIEIKGQLHFKTNNGNNVERTDSFTFNITGDKLMYCKFNPTGTRVSGEKYKDTYEARFVHASKEDFNGVEMDIENEIETQITMEDFNII